MKSVLRSRSRVAPLASASASTFYGGLSNGTSLLTSTARSERIWASSSHVIGKRRYERPRKTHPPALSTPTLRGTATGPVRLMHSYHTTRWLSQLQDEKKNGEKKPEDIEELEDQKQQADILVQKTGEMGLGFGGLHVEPSKEEPKKSMVTRVLSLATPEAKLIAAALGCLVIASGTNLLFPAGIGKIIDAVVNPASSEYSLQQIALALSGVFAVGGLTTFGRVAFLHIATERIVARLRKRLFGSILQQETAFFDANKTGELISRLSSDIVVVSKTITDNIALGIKRSTEGIGGVVILLYLTPKLTAVMLGVLPPVFLGGWFYGKWIKRLSRKVQDLLSKVSQFAEERISNIRTVKAFTKEGFEEKHYASKVDEAYNLTRKEGIAKGIFNGGLTFVGNIALLCIMGYGGTLVVNGEMSIGDLTSFLLYSAYVGFALSGSASFYADLMKGVGASSRVFELLDKKPAINPTGGIWLESSTVTGAIEFKDVVFRYPTREGRLIFNGFDLSVPAGHSLALVGESGSGKSTVAAMLARFYDPEKGSIYLDGKDIKELDPRSLRENIAIVSQDVVLFSGTIAENIQYGAREEDVSQEVLSALQAKAAKKANAHDFITAFPDGYETQVGERGVTLSGGQKQRIAIARAVIKNSPILILDEATSALDSTSERAVQLALQELMKGRTSIVIAHRLSTIKNADQIAVLHEGAIVEKGTHAELMAANGHYKKLVTQQLQVW